MSSDLTSYMLKGCNAKFINKIVMSSINGNNITYDIIDKATNIATTFNLNDCIKIISNFSNIEEI